MASVMAIVSKAVFDKMAPPKTVAVGQLIDTNRYVSKQKVFERELGEEGGGGALFLVTVRPEGERLWLVAILEAPEFDGEAWTAAKNAVRIVDITDVLGKLELASGEGVGVKKGKLGMSLQTPRVLSDADVTMLRGLAGVAEAPAAAARTEAQDLIAGVIERPDDESPRLVYADWLIEKGDARGEFISMQVALARRGLDPQRRLEFKKRCAQLEVSVAAWRAPAGDLQVVFRRGFIEEVTGDAGIFLKQADALFAAEPVRRVTLDGLDEAQARQIARAPWLSRLRHLTVRRPSKDRDAASHILAAATGLRGFSATGGAGAETAAGIGRSRSRFHWVTLTSNAVGDEGVKRLCTAALGECRALYLTRADLSDEGVTALASSPHVAALEHLSLNFNELGAGAVTALVESEHLAKLRRLEVENSELSDDDIGRLRERFGDRVAG
jgi:uncharacterized protein (TIGR02996 family)